MYDLGFDLPSRLIMSKPAALLSAVGTWTPTAATVTANAATAPDGTATASTLAPTSAAFAFAQPANITILSGVVYALSAYISSAAGPWVLMGISDGTNAFEVWFDANGGTVGVHAGALGTGSFVAASIKAAANGFFLATAMGIFSAGGNIPPLVACTTTNGGFVSSAAQSITVWHPTVQPLA